MSRTIQKSTRVLAVGRIEVDAPELAEGTTVQVIIAASDSRTTSASESQQSLADFLRSLPPSKRTLEEWEQFDREFRQERDSWDR